MVVQSIEEGELIVPMVEEKGIGAETGHHCDFLWLPEWGRVMLVN
jgi:hypothetical protein